ncbi:dipeptidase [Aestuariivirga sp.]|uniref:dipeptidase n=1 Tax=Aestuariivirga sp. TaxID=2650926 RepID=UPI003BA91DEB
MSAAALHAEALLIDGLMFRSDGSTELLRQGNVSAVNVTVSGLHADFEEACDGIAEWLVRVNDPASGWRLVTSVADIHQARADGKIGLIMGWQNMRAISDRIERLQLFHRLGVRVMQLTYNERNFIGDGCLEPADEGLSLFGRKVVREMNRLGIAIDLSHVGERSAREAAALSQRPVLLTHANAKYISNVPRNKSDDLIRAVAGTGGLIGLSVYGPMCWPGDPARRPCLDDFYRHLEHVVGLVGPDHVSLGTDFPAVKDLSLVETTIRMTLERYPAAISTYAAAFGNDVRTRYLSDCGAPAELSNVTAYLVKRGWSEEHILKFLGGNYLRVLPLIWNMHSL